MKKYIIVLPLLFISIGCGNKNEIVCTNNSTTDDINYLAKVTLKYEKNKVTQANAILEFNNEADKQKICNLYQSINSILKDEEKIEYECKKNTIEFNDYSSMMDVNIEKINKDEFVEKLNNEGYICKS